MLISNTYFLRSSETDEDVEEQEDDEEDDEFDFVSAVESLP